MQLSGVDVAVLESELEMPAKLLIAFVKNPFTARWRGCVEGGGLGFREEGGRGGSEGGAGESPAGTIGSPGCGEDGGVGFCKDGGESGGE